MRTQNLKTIQKCNSRLTITKARIRKAIGNFSIENLTALLTAFLAVILFN